MKRAAFVLLLLLASATAHSAVDVHRFDDPQREARYRHLIHELRCLVCQNQNLADSNADLAQDLRQEIYEMIQGGSSDEQIVDFMVARYGDFVLYRPPLKPSTLLLWAGPFLLLAAGAAVVITFVRRRRRPVPEAVVPEAERERARRLLEKREDGD
jgi:cytochrome c-type biogenesis protein CcmH